MRIPYWVKRSEGFVEEINNATTLKELFDIHNYSKYRYVNNKLYHEKLEFLRKQNLDNITKKKPIIKVNETE